MAEEKFLSRWSRLKNESKDLPQNESKDLPQETDDTPAPVLPPVDKLTPESDFKGFMHPKVDDALRRVALKKLFSDPHFNVPDPFEPYSGDWTVGEPISEEMLATLNQARTLIFSSEEKKDEAVAEEKPADNGNLAEDKPKDDDAGRKDA